MKEIRRILLPTDFSEASLEAFSYAVEVAHRFDAEILLMHVLEVHPPVLMEFALEARVFDMASALRGEAEARLEEMRTRIPPGVQTVALLVQGFAAETILEAIGTYDIDLVVLATHGRTGWRHLVFGSVAEKVVRLAGVPVLTVSARAAKAAAAPVRRVS